MFTFLFHLLFSDRVKGCFCVIVGLEAIFSGFYSFWSCVLFIQFLSYLCSARRGLRSEGDAPAEVPAPCERDPGTHSGGGCHPGELIATHTHTDTHNQAHFSPCSEDLARNGTLWLSSLYLPVCTQIQSPFTEPDSPSLSSLSTSLCIHSAECKLVARTSLVVLYLCPILVVALQTWLSNAKLSFSSPWKWVLIKTSVGNCFSRLRKTLKSRN